MELFNSAVDTLQTIVVGLGGALCVWGGINLLEGYGQDNPGSKSQGVKQLVAGGGVALIGVTLVPLLSGLLGLQPVERFLLLSVFATPVATASYPMAESMDGDGKLAAEFVAISTVASVATLFFWLTFFARYL